MDYNIACEIKKLITLKQEGSYWDFKREWHHNLPDLLHDIICMSNNLVNHDAYIIFGVDEENDYSIVDISDDPNRKSTQMMVDFLRSKKFAGGIRPTVYVQTISLQGKNIDILVIKNEYSTPYYLTQNFQGVFANNIYVRVMDSNTPKTSTADKNQVEYLWKKHFRLNAPPIEKVKFYLTQPNCWVKSPVEINSIKYYKYSPEYTMELISANRNGYEFYLFNQRDFTPYWYHINIRFHQTVISSFGGALLDGGNYFTSTPDSDFLEFSSTNPRNEFRYRYFIKDTLNYIVHSFFCEEDDEEMRHSYNRFMECVLVFESRQEKDKFNQYVLKEQKQIVELSQQVQLPYFPDLKDYNMSFFKEEFVHARVLKIMLNNFRTGSTLQE